MQGNLVACIREMYCPSRQFGCFSPGEEKVLSNGAIGLLITWERCYHTWQLECLLQRKDYYPSGQCGCLLSGKGKGAERQGIKVASYLEKVLSGRAMQFPVSRERHCKTGKFSYLLVAYYLGKVLFERAMGLLVTCVRYRQTGQ